MPISFFETMNGDLHDRWGKAWPVVFDLKAEATRARHFFTTGEARITGIVHAPPWAQAGALDGTLALKPFTRRTLTYDFTFTGDDEATYRLVGVKNLKLTAPFHSGSNLTAVLTRDGERVARGAMRFDLNGLFEFLSTWNVHSTLRPVDTKRLPERPNPGDFTDAERELLLAFAQATIPAGEKVPAVDLDTIDDALRWVDKMGAEVAPAFRMALRWLDAVSLVRYRRRFLKLSAGDRALLVEALFDPEPEAGLLPSRRLAHLLAMPVRSAHFARRDYLEKVGVPDFENKVKDEPARWRQQIMEPETMDPETELACEVVIVGTGAGGAAMAASLAEKGIAVALVEEGRYHPRSHFSGSPLKRMERFYRHGGLTFSMGRPPISIPLGRMVGGTTTINSGTCFRTPDEVLETWRREHGLPEEFNGQDLDGYFARVEHELAIQPGQMKHMGHIGQVIAQGAEAMGYQHGPLPRNAEGCDGQGVCIFGCPTGAKRSADVTWIPRALSAGAVCFTGLPMTRILRRGKRAIGIEARGHDAHGAPKRLVIKAQAVVLSCGSLLTPLLLQDNGYRNAWLGKNLSVHPGFGMVGMFDVPTQPWNAVPQGYGVKALEEEGVRYEGFYLPPEMLTSMLVNTGEELTRWMDAQDRIGSFGFMVKDENRGRVLRRPDGRPLVQYELSDESVRKLTLGASLLAELMLEGGASELIAPIGSHPRIKTLAEARALKDARIAPIDFNLLGAHPLGTARMGRGPADSVVDHEHRVHGTDNLYVVDASVIPTSLGVNPQVTIMTMALRAADRLAARLHGELSAAA